MARTAFGQDLSSLINLPATFDRCNNLTVASLGASSMSYAIQMGGDLNVAGTFNLVAAIALGSTSSTKFYTSTATLDVTGAITVGAYSTLDVSEGVLIANSTINNSATDATLKFNNSTSAYLKGAVTKNGDATYDQIYDVGTLVLEGATILTLAEDLVVNNNFEVRNTGGGNTLTAGANNITVFGDMLVSNNDATGSALATPTGTITLYGDLSEGIGTSTDTDDLYGDATPEFDLVITEVSEGSSPIFTSPVELTELGTLTLNREAGMKLLADELSVTDAGNSIIITDGNIDLNGRHILEIGDVDGVIQETGGKVINTGADGGYLSTLSGAALSIAQVLASNIGVTAISSPGAATFTIRRHPIQTLIEGDFDTRISTVRYYTVEELNAQDVTSMTFRIDDDEYGTNSFIGLEAYRVTHTHTLNTAEFPGFTTSVTLIDDENPNANFEITPSPQTGYGLVEVSGTHSTGDYIMSASGTNAFAFASQRTSTGAIITFDNSAGTYRWNDYTNWSLDRLPTIEDDVVIGYPVTMNNVSGGATAGSILFNDADAATGIKGSLQPAGDATVDVYVLGGIQFTGDNYINGVNGNGRMNFIFGDLDAAPTEYSLSPNADYSSTSGMTFYDLTLRNVSMTQTPYAIAIKGDLNLEGLSVFNSSTAGCEVVFEGGAVEVGGQQDIRADEIATATFYDLTLDLGTTVGTDASLTLTHLLKLKTAGCQFVQAGDDQAATFTISTSGNIDAWDVFEGAYCQFDNLSIGASDADVTPYGDIYVRGKFTFAPTGTGAFYHNRLPGSTVAGKGSHPDGNAVIFTDATVLGAIENTGDATDLNFDEIRVLSNCYAKTNSDFVVNRAIYVEKNATFEATAGTITLDLGENNVDNIFIENISNHTLSFYNLTIADPTYTYSDFKITGDLAANANFDCYNGTITFANLAARTISSTGGDIFFHKILFPDGSIVTTDVGFSITNNAANALYKDDAGIEVQGDGSFVQSAGIVTFNTLDAAAPNRDPGPGHPKQIIVSEDGTLNLFRVLIDNEVNNDVTTESNFTIGYAAANGTVGEYGIKVGTADRGGTFTAFGGSTITFNGTADVAVGLENDRGADDALVLDNIIFDGIKGVLDDGHYLTVTGDITLNNTGASFEQQNQSAAGAFLRFTGLEQQKINGTTPATPAVSFTGIEINKPYTGSVTNQEVTLEAVTEWTDHAQIALYLTEGYLNIGSQTLTINDFAAGAYMQIPHDAPSGSGINGGTGTILLNEALSNTTTFLRDMTFTVDGTPTLYNLTVQLATNALANNLTINNDLIFLTGGALDITTTASNPEVLTLYGNLESPTGGGTYFTGDASGIIKLLGSGTVLGLNNTQYVTASSGFPTNLYIGREEALSGDLTMNVGTEFVIDCGVNLFSLGSSTLDLSSAASISRISGSVDAGVSSTVVWSANDVVMPSNFFNNAECGTLDLSSIAGLDPNFTIQGDLKVNTELAGVVDIYTGENILEIAPACTSIPAFDADNHIIGNLRRTVNRSPIKFPLGGGTSTTYAPITLEAASSSTSQQYLVYLDLKDPTYDRGGEPNDAINVTWMLTPEGTITNDDVRMTWEWASEFESVANGGNPATANNVTVANWEEIGTYWQDYSSYLAAFTSVLDPRTIYTNTPNIPIANTTGAWGIFCYSGENPLITDVDTEVGQTDESQRADAVSSIKNKVKITRITNLPVGGPQSAQVTVQLQDRYGQPIVTDEKFNVTIRETVGNGGWNPATYTIDPGTSLVTFNMEYSNACDKIQLVADTVGSSDRWLPTTSELFSSLSLTPGTQASTITISNITPTSADIQFMNEADGYTILLAKANNLLEPATDYPTDGVTYLGNALLGAGSSIGEASVVYNEYAALAPAGISFSLYGLAPNTEYAIGAFNYSTAGTGTEKYLTGVASGNNVLFTTSGTNDDDISYGSNNTRNDAKAIGTNSPIHGTIKSSTDEDWFCFTVTSAAGNIRATMNNLPENYNFELYNLSDRRLRRAIRLDNNPEAAVINDLPASSYLIRIYSADGYFDVDNTYELKIETKGSEIFSITP